MATASVTLALNQSTFLAGIARAQGAVSGLGASVGRIGARGFLAAGTAAVAFATAAAWGIKKAFDLGGSLADMSAISGKSAKEILLLRRALEDAGISMEKIDRFILTGQDRGQVIARALQNMSSGDWRDAAQSVGKQADILEKNAKTFDRVSDLLGRSGQKLQGFFVGAAGAIGNALLPILEKFDKMDFAAQGQKFGDGLLEGAQALVGFFKKPELMTKPFEDAFAASILGLGNVLYAVFSKAGDVLGAYLYEAGQRILHPLKSWTEGKTLTDQVTENLAGSKLEIKDVFGAGAALANARAGVAGAAGVGQNILPPSAAAPDKGMTAAERAAAGQKKFQENQQAAAKAIENITFAGTSGIDASMFSKNAMASEDEFADRWGPPKPAGQKGNTKEDQLQAKMAEDTAAIRELNEKAWGDR